jgi:transketolase
MNRATREAFGEQLVESGRKHKNILALNADLGKATKIAEFGKAFPDRLFEVGIAENNMIGIASGLSEYGYKVFIASFASFLTGKYDTIRISLAYSKAPVILIGTHCGLSIGKDGVTQMGLEDLSLMRSLPNMVVLNPATFNETKSVIKYLCDTELHTPHYVRIGRQPVEEVFEENFQFNFGKAQVIKTGKNAIILSTGCILSDVINAAKDLNVTILNITTLKPIDLELNNILSEYSKIITIEDHSIIGGLGSIISEIIADNGLNSKLTRIGINDVFPESGIPAELYNKYGLSENKIKEKILNVLNDK